MTWLYAISIIAGVAACAKPPATQPTTGPTIATMAELGLLMKNEINPAFSRLSFLMFHGDDMETDEAALKAELGRHANSLRQAIGRLRSWSRVPAQTEEGRQVFFTFAESVDRSAERLVVAIGSGERTSAASQLEQIADTCNNCHHFFRLKIEDSVVPTKAARLDHAHGGDDPALPSLDQGVLR